MIEESPRNRRKLIFETVIILTTTLSSAYVANRVATQEHDDTPCGMKAIIHEIPDNTSSANLSRFITLPLLEVCSGETVEV